MKEKKSLEEVEMNSKDAEDRLKDVMEKAKATVKNIYTKIGQPWDGKREDSPLSLELLTEKVNNSITDSIINSINHIDK